jgi:hypothetical protein
MRSPARTLSSLKIPVRGRSAAFARLQLIAVQRSAERTAGGPPFEASLGEDAIEALGFRLAPDALRAGNDPGRNDRMTELGNRHCGANIIDAAVGTRTDENPIDSDDIAPPLA